MRIILKSNENHCQTRWWPRVVPVLVVNRFRVPEEEAAGFRADLESALAVLAARSGFVDGRLGRNLDDPTLWTMVTGWQDVGSYRRALSSYDVKVGAVPLLSRAIDEPSAYEPVAGELNEWRPRQRG
jgi:quinol monooxygenase YgiN